MERISIKQRDLVVMKFPFTNQVSVKARPGIVISKNAYNTKSEDVLFIPLTSKIKEEPYSLRIEQKELETGILKVTSRIKFDKIQSVEKTNILKTIGTIKQDFFEEIKKKMCELI